MKKVLVILTVLILVASAVFAEETHSVRITTQIESKTPTFILRAGLSPASFNSVESDEDDSINTLGWEMVEKSIQKEDVEVYFQIVQKGVARYLGQKFSLSIETSEMILGMNEDGTALAPDAKVHRTTRGVISDVSLIGGEKSNVAVSLAETTSGMVNLVAEYKGMVQDGEPIASFAVTWAKDINAPDGIYQASVILKVSPL